MPEMRYVPFDQLEPGVPHLMVDSYGKERSCVLELNHWPGNGTPPSLKRDTSTESVIAWTGAADPVVDRLAIRGVSNDHFDLDGLLGMWAAIFPELAAEDGERLVNVATTEDFNLFVDEPSLRITLELLAVEKQITRGLIRHGVSSTDRFTARLYEALLPEVSRCMRSPLLHEEHWREELRFVVRSLEDLQHGRCGAHIEEIEEIDLAVVRADRPLHPFAVHAATQRCRLLVFAPGSRPSFSYRYESFVEFVSRPIAPRLPMKPLASLLGRKERNGVWSGEGMLAAHPRVQLFGSDGSVVQSSMRGREIMATVVDYLKALDFSGHAGWLPISGLVGGPELDLLPPSMERSLQDVGGG